MDRGEGGEEVVGERAINFETDQGHRGAEVLQRSWELFFFFFCYAGIYSHITSLVQVNWNFFFLLLKYLLI